jgi:hypothetical protein
LNDLSSQLSSLEVGDLVGRLNTPDARLAATWELAVCYGLSRVGDCSYHDPLPTGRKPDVVFRLPDSRQVSFVADVTTISDDGYHRENRVEEFSDNFASIVRRAGLDPNKFHFRIESTRINHNVKLLIPEPNQRFETLRRHLHPFLREIKQGGCDTLQRTFSEPDFAITVSYDSRQRYMGSSYRPYNQARSIDQNPLRRGLEMKARQLKGAEGLIGVIVCDGGCALLSGGAGRDVDAFSAYDVIQNFLRTSSSVNFVYTITSRRRHGLTDDCIFDGRLWARDPATRTFIEPIMLSALKSLPPPIFDSQNAAIQAEQKTYDFGSRAKDFSYGSDGEKIVSVNMSARRLLEILAGKHSPSDIDTICGGPNDEIPGWPNPFKKALAKGQLIKEIAIEPIIGRDDDLAVITFGEPDPAVAPFRGGKASR